MLDDPLHQRLANEREDLVQAHEPLSLRDSSARHERTRSGLAITDRERVPEPHQDGAVLRDGELSLRLGGGFVLLPPSLDGSADRLLGRGTRVVTPLIWRSVRNMVAPATASHEKDHLRGLATPARVDLEPSDHRDPKLVHRSERIDYEIDPIGAINEEAVLDRDGLANRIELTGFNPTDGPAPNNRTLSQGETDAPTDVESIAISTLGANARAELSLQETRDGHLGCTVSGLAHGLSAVHLGGKRVIADADAVVAQDLVRAVSNRDQSTIRRFRRIALLRHLTKMQ